jgi:hypothetical protein
MDVLTCLAVIDRLDLGRLPDDPTGRAIRRREIRIDRGTRLIFGPSIDATG